MIIKIEKKTRLLTKKVLHNCPRCFLFLTVETILYPELSRSNRQANMSGRAMDAENHWLLLTWVPRPRVSRPRVSRPQVSRPRVSRPRVSRPRVSRPWVSCLRFSSPRVPRPRVSGPRVSGLRFSSPRIPRSRVSRPRVPRPSYSLVTARQKEEKYIGFLSTVKKKNSNFGFKRYSVDKVL